MLHKLVLALSIRDRNDVLAQPADRDHNKCHRFAAYRRYILWTHDHLVAGNRRVIPSYFIGGSGTSIRMCQGSTLDILEKDLGSKIKWSL